MEIPPTVQFAGHTFRLQSSGRYYQSDSKHLAERLLHRFMWAYYNGPIPEGMDVHHINHLWHDTRPLNLEIIPKAEHAEYHMRERFKDPEYRARNKVHIASAQEAAKAWHASADGRAWHSANGKAAWEKRRPVPVVCSVCGKDDFSFYPNKYRVCSCSCANRRALSKRAPEDRVCVMCGADFQVDRYRTTKTCSRKCAANLTAKIRRGVQPDS